MLDQKLLLTLLKKKTKNPLGLFEMKCYKRKKNFGKVKITIICNENSFYKPRPNSHY